MTAQGRVPVYAAGGRKAAVQRTPEDQGQTTECAVQRSAAAVWCAVLRGQLLPLATAGFRTVLFQGPSNVERSPPAQK